jgi:hypothetical protein
VPPNFITFIPILLVVKAVAAYVNSACKGRGWGFMNKTLEGEVYKKIKSVACRPK